MAVSGQGRLRARHLCMAGFMCVSAPAVAQQGAGGREERSLDLRLHGSAVYDSNAARSGRAQAAARGLAREEMEFRPSVTAALSLPFDQHAFFADADVGYEFHSRNKRLESERVSAQGGVRLRVRGCTVESAGRYARRLTELGDIYDEPADNVEEVVGARGALRCERLVGVSPVASASYSRTRNALAVRKRSDVDELSISAGLAYQQPSLGRLSLTGALTDARYPNRVVAGRHDGVRTWSAGLTIERRTGTRLQGSVTANYIWVDPDLPDVAAFSGPSYGADIIWLAGPRAKISLSAVRTVEASNRLDVSYFRQDMMRLSGRYVLTTRLNAETRASWRVRKYAATTVFPGAEPPGSDRSLALGAGLSFALNRRILIGMDADWQSRDAAVDLFDYRGFRLGVSGNWRM